MPPLNYNKIITQQRLFFAAGNTLPISFRVQQLTKLKSLIQTHENEIYLAMQKDLNKSPMESFLCEVSLVIDEINLMIKNLKKWTRPKKARTPFPLWPGKSEIYYEPYGCALIIASWNYPFILLMSPLIGAIAAGNCVIVKPSELATQTQDFIFQLINSHFPPDYLIAVKADPEQTNALLEERFDYIFFTGGTQIGKIVMTAAAKHLTPVTLELGGKSPCIVDETADLEYAARRIVWGKFLNAGQTCIAPDYLLVQENIKEKLLQKIQNTIIKFYGDDAKKSTSYGRIINKKHFDRLSQLLQTGTIVQGAKTNPAELYISPTLITDITWQDPIMQQEIFGPLLPILTFTKIEDVINTIKQHEKPLALYYFTKSKEKADTLLSQLSFGGGCINDCLIHVANLHLPFGGVGMSGMGNYHGKFSFDTFSHKKSMFKKTMLIDFDFQYPPYNEKKFTLIKKIMNFKNKWF